MTELFAKILALFDLAEPRLNFDIFRDMIFVDSCNKFDSQPLLSDQNIAVQFMLPEIQDMHLSTSKTPMSPLGL